MGHAQEILERAEREMATRELDVVRSVSIPCTGGLSVLLLINGYCLPALIGRRVSGTAAHSSPADFTRFQLKRTQTIIDCNR
jgi:hypothetical protein